MYNGAQITGKRQARRSAALHTMSTCYAKQWLPVISWPGGHARDRC